MFNDNTNISKILDWINNYKEILDLIGDSTDNKTIMSLLKQSLIEDIENMINGNWKSIRFRLKNSIHTKGYGNYGEKKRELLMSLINIDPEVYQNIEKEYSLESELRNLKILKSKSKKIFTYDYKNYSSEFKNPKETIKYLTKDDYKNLHHIYSFLDNKHRFEKLIGWDYSDKKYVKNQKSKELD